MIFDSQLELEFAPDKSTAGYRLHELSVLNWGTFHNPVYSMRPDGRTSMITGRNGSGKSNIVDALLTLLVPNRVRNYNVASSQAGSRERNERDYVLGAYSEIHDITTGQGRKETLRKPGESYTVLLAHFYNEAYKSDVSIAQILWCLPSGKIDKIYLVEKRKLSIRKISMILVMSIILEELLKSGILRLLIPLLHIIRSLKLFYLWMRIWGAVLQCQFLIRPFVLKM